MPLLVYVFHVYASCRYVVWCVVVFAYMQNVLTCFISVSLGQWCIFRCIAVMYCDIVMFGVVVLC